MRSLERADSFVRVPANNGYSSPDPLPDLEESVAFCLIAVRRRRDCRDLGGVRLTRSEILHSGKAVAPCRLSYGFILTKALTARLRSLCLLRGSQLPQVIFDAFQSSNALHYVLLLLVDPRLAEEELAKDGSLPCVAHVKATWGIQMEHTSSANRAKLALHYVDGETKGRAQFAQIALALGHHCELYDDLSELSMHPPRHGIIIMRDDSGFGRINTALQRLEQIGIWLPVIAAGEAPTPDKIVEAIKTGALDYLAMPFESSRLERSIARISNEAERVADLRRKKVKAQALIKRLSEREGQVLDFLVEGQSNKQIARELDISPRTVEIHRANMMTKLEAEHAASAIRIKLEADQMQIAC